MERKDCVSGYTLVEMLVAISIAGIVMTLIFGAYSGLFRGFRIHIDHAATVREMIVNKKRIEGMLDVLKSIEVAESGMIQGNNERDSAIVISYEDGMITDGSLTIPLDSFACVVRETKKQDGGGFLLWDAVITGGKWVGGAHAVSVGEGQGR